MVFLELYRSFVKATTFFQNTSFSRKGGKDQRKGGRAPTDRDREQFRALCERMDEAWANMNESDRNEAARRMVAEEGSQSLIFHYQLYGKAKEAYGQGVKTKRDIGHPGAIVRVS